MYRPPIEYQSRRVQTSLLSTDWRRRRFGTASLAVAGLAVLVATSAVGTTIVFGLRNSFLPRVLGGCAVLLLAGGATGVFGTDFDRERKFAYVGIFLT